MNYKYAIRAIKRKEDTIKADNAAKKLTNNNYAGFWNAVRKFNNNRSTLHQQIGEVVGEQDICNK